MKDVLRTLAVNIAKGAGEVIRATAPEGISTKSSNTDLVTDADQAAEAYIFDRIRRERPRDSIISEEGSLYEGSNGVTWVIDPLDGTTNFVYDIPQWAVSIGIEGEVRAGVVYDAMRRETFTDIDDLNPSRKTTLDDALIGTGFSYSADVRRDQAMLLTKVLPLVRDIRRAGSCALDLAWVAAGRLDAFFEKDTHHWDISAGIAIVEGVGGAVHTQGSLTIAAGNAVLLSKLVRLVLD